MKSIKKLLVAFLGIVLIFIPSNTLAAEEIECALSSSASMATPPANVKAMIVYAKDSNDNYPFPSTTLRNEIQNRLAGLYSTISYGNHTITFKETTNNGDYFVSDFDASYYKNNFTSGVHDRGYGMFNEEILNKVVTLKGVDWFSNIDIIIYG